MSLKEKYPTANYDPDPTCKNCGGTGELVNQGAPCICIFVGDPEFRKVVSSSLAKIAKNLRLQGVNYD